MGVSAASKRALVPIISFILTTFKNEQHPCKYGRVNGNGDLENSTDVSNLIVDDFIISTRNAGGDASWFNRKNKRHNRSIHTMVREGIIESNQQEKKL